MARTFTPPPATIAEVLSLLPGDVLRPLMDLLPLARPLPTRKADIVIAIEHHLSGDTLVELWNRLDETQQLAVREALHAPHSVFHPDQFKAKHGRLPFGFDSSPSPRNRSTAAWDTTALTTGAFSRAGYVLCLHGEAVLGRRRAPARRPDRLREGFPQGGPRAGLRHAAKLMRFGRARLRAGRHAYS